MSQTEQILNYLEEGNTITPIEALNKFGCFRLTSRIHDLKKQGIKVCSRMVESNGKRYSEYFIPGQLEMTLEG